GTRKPSNKHIQRALVGFINFSLGDNLVGLNGKVAVAEKLEPFFDIVVGNGFGLYGGQMLAICVQLTLKLENSLKREV
ncbi:TPA: hypothetical protein ACGO8E_002406, partial [Streptococcus suis]